MATTFHLQSDNALVSGYSIMQPTVGNNLTTAIVNTAAGGTDIQWTATAGGSVLAWISPPLAAFTLAGTVTYNIWAQESSMNANAGGRSRLFKWSAGTETLIAGPTNDGTEFPFNGSSNAFNWTATPTSTAFANGDRIVVKFYITGVGTMGGSLTCTLRYHGATANADGDSFITITENVIPRNRVVHIT